MVKILNATKEETEKWGKNEWDKVSVEHFGKNTKWKEKDFRFKATEGKKTVGYISGKFEVGVLKIKTLIVAEDSRGSGVGTMLIKKAEKFGEKMGAHQIWLNTGKDWKARKFYEKLGYKTQAELPDFYYHHDFVIYTKKV